MLLFVTYNIFIEDSSLLSKKNSLHGFINKLECRLTLLTSLKYHRELSLWGQVTGIQ